MDWKQYVGRITGVVIALLICLSLFTLGFWKTFLICIISLIGFLCGYAVDKGYSLSEIISILLKKNGD